MPLSQFCKDGVPPHTHEDFVKVLDKMNAESIALGVILIVGTIASTIPQHIKIWQNKSTVGLSCLWLFLGNVNQFSSVINAVVMKFPQLQACSILGVGECTPSLLALYQLLALWLFSFPLYIWYLKFSIPSVMHRREWLMARVLFGILLAFIVVAIGAAVVTLTEFGDCAYVTLGFGYTMGIVSTVMTFTQWAPQIYSTFRAKSVGSFSILMLAMQAPGSFIIIFFFIFVSHENISTWLSYVSTACQQILLLSLLCVYDYRAKKAAKNNKQDDTEIAPLIDNM